MSKLLEEANRIRDNALDALAARAKEKYDKGQREHGGLITERVCLDDLEDEIIDLWFYVQALRTKISRIQRPTMADALDAIRTWEDEDDY